MEEVVDKVKEIIGPLLYAINRHDKLNKLNFAVGGGAIVDSILFGKIQKDFDIFLMDLEVGDYFYQILRDIGYRQYDQNTWARKFRSFNNEIDVCHLRTFTQEEYINNVDMTVASGLLDNNLIFHCRPEFFDDVENKVINIVNINEPDPRLEYRVNKMKEKGFKLNKESEKLYNIYYRGGDYKKLLKPISKNDILMF